MYDPTSLESVFSDWGIRLPGSRFLVAFSGGLDSTVLAESMYHLNMKHAFELSLGHVNHRLRPESDSDELFCQQYATERGIPFFSATLNPSQLQGESIEAWGRRERYARLEGMRSEAGAEWILTAHHSDDQAETVIMRLAQQAPLITLAGIRARRGRILRPFLAVSRDELREWATRVGLTWIEDASNIDQRFLRNQLRHNQLWSAVTTNAGAKDTLLGLAKLAQGYESACVEAATGIAAMASGGSIPGTVMVSVKALLAVELDVFKIAVKMIVRKFMGTNIRLSTPHWQNFCHFVRAASVGKVFELPHGVQVLMDRSRLVVYHAELASAPEMMRLETGRTKWGFHEFLVKAADSSHRSTDLQLRSWRTGDKASLGPGRPLRLLSDIYTDAHFNRLEKTQWPLVVTGNSQVVWVPGLGVPGRHLEEAHGRIAWQTEIHRR
ncbi:MAG: tRNA lysidine(34) synthetase TilS [Fidelibacterota bacterium]|nr:MAG: tRNA lysidine(34) synthetase TilS [Candidatus Neomarinimicrobiota bacterium]